MTVRSGGAAFDSERKSLRKGEEFNTEGAEEEEDTEKRGKEREDRKAAAGGWAG